MKRKYDLRFLLFYLRWSISKMLPKINLTETNIFHILISLCIIFCCSIFAYTFSTNWYDDSNNLNSLLTEVQGMIIEVFFFAIIMNWLMVLRENAKQKPLKSYYHYAMAQEIEKFLRITLPDIKKKEKKYIYFLDKSVSTYYHDDLLIYDSPIDKEIFEILYENKEYEYFYEHYLKSKRILLKELKKILLNNMFLFEYEIIYKFLELENYNETLIYKENEITKDNCNFENINKFITAGSYRVFFILLSQIRNLIIKKSDKVLSSIEEEKKGKKELEKWTKLVTKMKSDM